MARFWERILGRKSKYGAGSADRAKERLKFILLHDRINLPPGQLQAMKTEILTVISKYLAVAGSDIEITLRQHDRDSNMLIAEIPFIKNVRPSAAEATPGEDTMAADAVDAEADIKEHKEEVNGAVRSAATLVETGLITDSEGETTTESDSDKSRE